MPGAVITSLANKLQDLEQCLKSQDKKEVGYGRALRDAIISKDCFIEVEVLKCLGDLHLEKGKFTKDSIEFDKAAGFFAAALLRCKDPDMGETLEHRIGYMEKLSRQLLQGYSPHFLWLSEDYWGTADSNVLRVAEICHKVDSVRNSFEQTYTELLANTIGNSDMFLELEVLKSLGDLYLDKGKTTSDVSQFFKAAVMYQKALTRCGDPGIKLTLKHRMRYMDKIREALEKKSSTKKQKPRERSLPMKQQSENITSNDIIQDNHLHPDMTSDETEPWMSSFASGSDVDVKNNDGLYKDKLQEGESSLASGYLDLAEQNFAAALKLVHVRDPTVQQYQREVEPLHKLGDVYSKRGQQTGDGGDFVKAAALYNAAMARSEDQVLNGIITKGIKAVEMLFIRYILGIHCNIKQDDTDKHKKLLKEMRDQIKLEIETIDQQLDPYVYDEDDPCVKETEAKRAQAVRQLFENIAQQRKEFVSLLVEECIGLMGPSPCTYALIGLGSQATALVTPYSDLEFAILVEDESEERLVYFRNLTYYLHLKVVNLGETIIPALGIKSLNDFYSKNPLDDWYYDSVTPRGFAFDGSMPKASKTPLGRQRTVNEPPSELICTPEHMVSILRNDVTLYLKEGYHLATVLRNPCLIAGDQDLINTYMTITGQILKADGGKMARQLAEEEKWKIFSSPKKSITERLIDVKKEIYRFPAVAVDCLALSAGIIPTTVWKTIEEMETQNVISANNAHHLIVLTSISAELRLRTYIANGGQKENFSALASMETVPHGQESVLHTNDEMQTSVIKPVFYLPNEKQLFRYYYTAIPLAKVLKPWADPAITSLMRALYPFHPVKEESPNFCDMSPEIRGAMYFKLCKFRLSILYFDEALKKDVHSDTVKSVLFNNVGDAWQLVGDYQKAITYYEHALQIRKNIHGQSTAHLDIASSLNNLGTAYHNLGDFIKAISYHEQALQMERIIHGQCAEHSDICISLSNLGTVWSSLGDYSKAISYFEQTLRMERSIYGQSTPHPRIARSFNNLGSTWQNLGDLRKAIWCHEKALQIHRTVYGQNTAHPKISDSLENIGSVWYELGDHRKAISYYEQSLQMRRVIYGHGTTHPHIAFSLNNLAEAWRHLGHYRKAISYLQQALQMFKIIYGENRAHPHISTLLGNLGEAWGYLDDNKKSINYLEQELQMLMKIYGQSTEHRDIAKSLSNLGKSWLGLRYYRKAISYNEQALRMYRSIYGRDTTHHETGTILSILGLAWGELGENRKAISCYEKALFVYRSNFVPGKTHQYVAITLSNLAMALRDLGDYRKAINHFEQALQMFSDIYGQSTAHIDIVNSLANLGLAWDGLGDHKKAIALLQKALVMAKQIYHQEKSHPKIKVIERHIDQIRSNFMIN